MDFYYPNIQNDMWRILGLLFYADKDYFLETPKSFSEEKCRAFCHKVGLGLGDTGMEVIRQKGNGPWMTEACPALVSPTSGCLQHEPVVVQPQTAGPSPSPCSQHSVSWVQGAGRSHKHPQGAEPLQHSPVCPDTNGSTCTASAQTATNGPVLPKAAALLPPIYSRRGACELQRRGARVAAGFDQDKAARGAPGGGRSGAVPGLSTRWL